MANPLERVPQISSIIQKIASQTDLDAALRTAATLVQQVFNYPSVALFVVNEPRLVLKAVAGGSFPTRYVQPLESGLAGWAATHSETVIVNNVKQDDRYVSGDGLSPVGTEVCLPIAIPGQVVGVLDIKFPQPNAFDPADVPLLEMLANTLAIVINAARNRAELQKQVAAQAAQIEQLSRDVELFRNVVVSVSAHIYVTEVTENGDLVNHYIAPNVETLTGYPHQQFITDWGFWPNTVIYPADRRRAAAQSGWLKRGKNSTVEYRLVRADGEIIWVRDSGRVVDFGTSQMIYGVVSDITDRKDAEQALENERALLADRVAERTSELSAANAKLARAARLKDEFLANMSHELRTPLNAILGMSEVLQSGVYGELNAEQKNAAHHIEESGSHLLALITDILDLSKIGAEKLELDITPVYIDYVCEASLRMIHQVAKKKQIKVTSRFDERVKTIRADQRRLKQILVNLLSNAVKFTPEGGQVGLYVQGDTEHEVVRFIVWDTGIGIVEEDFSQLFKPFVQLDSKLSPQHEGSGLGLSLVARLAEMHGGGISVESEPGEGSRFTVSLPWQEEPDAEDGAALADQPDSPEISAENSSPDPAGANPQTVLLAEDNEANVITLTEFLKGLDYRVIVARNGNEAVSRAIEEKPDIILMDIQMPGIDGLEATRQIRAADGVADLPIIALTALAMPGDRERCLAAGANDYLSKPVSLRKLIAAISAQLNTTAESADKTPHG